MDLPPTHDRGSLPISGIFISPNLIPVRAGILRHGVGILGDHRNMFIDFQETNFLGDELFTIPPPKLRRLQLFDSRIVNKFNKLCCSHLTNNNIPHKAQRVLSASQYTPPQDMASSMNTLDDQLGRAIAHGDKHCRKMRTGVIPFSTQYNKVKNEVRFWILLLRRNYGHRISNTTIRRLARRLDISHPNLIDPVETKLQLKLARQRYVAFASSTKSERTQFNERLATANAADENKPKARVLKRILHDESQRQENLQLKSTYQKSQMERLDSVRVFRDGTRLEFSSPHEVEEELRIMNDMKYSSTNDTPLMTPQYV